MTLTNVVITEESKFVQEAIVNFRQTVKQNFKSTISEERNKIIEDAAERAIKNFLHYKDFYNNATQNFEKLMQLFRNECPFIR